VVSLIVPVKARVSSLVSPPELMVPVAPVFVMMVVLMPAAGAVVSSV